MIEKLVLLIICIPIIGYIILVAFENQAINSTYCNSKNTSICTFILSPYVSFFRKHLSLSDFGKIYFILLGFQLCFIPYYLNTTLSKNYLIVYCYLGLACSFCLLIYQFFIIRIFCIYCITFNCLVISETLLIDYIQKISNLRNTEVLNQQILSYRNYYYLAWLIILFVSYFFSYFRQKKISKSIFPNNNFDEVDPKILKTDIIIYRDVQKTPVVLIVSPFCTYCMWCLNEVLQLQHKQKLIFPIIIRFYHEDPENVVTRKIELYMYSLQLNFTDKEKIQLLKEWYRIPHLSYIQKKYGYPDIQLLSNDSEPSSWARELKIEKTPTIIIGKWILKGFNKPKLNELLLKYYKK